MDLSGLNSVNTSVQMIDWLSANCLSPIDPVMTGTDFGVIMQKIINVITDQSGGTGGVSGTGTVNHLSKWTSGSALGDSTIQDNTNMVTVNNHTTINGYLITDINLDNSPPVVEVNDFGKLIIGQNKSGSRGETDFISILGNAPYAKGGFWFSVKDVTSTDSANSERLLVLMDGPTGTTEFYGAIKTASPVGSNAIPFKIGQVEAVSGKSLNTGAALTIEFEGTIYHLAILS